jgi:hypothetical protein
MVKWAAESMPERMPARMPKGLAIRISRRKLTYRPHQQEPKGKKKNL